MADKPNPKVLGTGAARKAGEAIKNRKKNLDDAIDKQSKAKGKKKVYG